MGKFTNIFKDGEIEGFSPDAAGDNYLVYDIQRDHHYWHEKITDVIKYISYLKKDCLILYGGNITDAGGGKINISECAAIGKDINGNRKLIFLPAQNALNLPVGWNDNRQIWVRLRYDSKLGTEIRNHFKTGSYHYTLLDSFIGEASSDDLFMTTDPNTIPDTDICLGSFRMNGTIFSLVPGFKSQFFYPESVVPGMIFPFAGVNCPLGYLFCDGSALSRMVYANLFTSIGISWGPGDGSTTFNIPDTRGIYLKGAGVSGKLLDSAGNPFSGILALYENDMIENHTHGTKADFKQSPGPTPLRQVKTESIASLSARILTGNHDGRDGPRTQPASVGMNFIIKY